VKAGDTLFFAGRDDHLWVIISDPAIDPQRIIIVPFITYQRYYDQSCIVQAGEHPFVKHKTLVNYSVAAIATLDELQAAPGLKVKEALSDELLQRIRACARGSNLPLESMEILVEQELVE
jgi:hypothetical protein